MVPIVLKILTHTHVDIPIFLTNQLQKTEISRPSPAPRGHPKPRPRAERRAGRADACGDVVALSETTDAADFEAADLARTAGSMGYQQRPLK